MDYRQTGVYGSSLAIDDISRISTGALQAQLWTQALHGLTEGGATIQGLGDTGWREETGRLGTGGPTFARS